MDILNYVIAILLIVSGSVSINYYIRLKDCDSSQVSTDSFSYIYSIVSICAGGLYLLYKIKKLVSFSSLSI